MDNVTLVPRIMDNGMPFVCFRTMVIMYNGMPIGCVQNHTTKDEPDDGVRFAIFWPDNKPAHGRLTRYETEAHALADITRQYLHHENYQNMIDAERSERSERGER